MRTSPVGTTTVESVESAERMVDNSFAASPTSSPLSTPPAPLQNNTIPVRAVAVAVAVDYKSMSGTCGLVACGPLNLRKIYIEGETGVIIPCLRLVLWKSHLVPSVVVVATWGQGQVTCARSCREASIPAHWIPCIFSFKRDMRLDCTIF